MWPGGEFGERDRTHRHDFRERSGHGRIVPVDDDRRVEQARSHLEPLVHDPIKIRTKPFPVDRRSLRGENGKFCHRYECPARLPDGAQFRHGHAIAGDDEALAGRDGLDHPGVVVAEFPLRDRSGHEVIVACSATYCYVLLRTATYCYERGARLTDDPFPDL